MRYLEASATQWESRGVITSRSFESDKRGSQHECQLTQVSLSEALIWPGTAKALCMPLRGGPREACFCVWSVCFFSLLPSRPEQRALYGCLQGEEWAWRQKVGPRTRPAVCRRLLEMERGPTLWVGWLGPSWAGPGPEQVGVRTETVNESLSRETLEGGGWFCQGFLLGLRPTFHSRSQKLQPGPVTLILSSESNDLTTLTWFLSDVEQRRLRGLISHNLVTR